jgi:HSP20 family protein
MALRHLIPRNNGSRDLSLHRNEPNPFLALHREMNRLFDDTFRSFDIAPFSSQAIGWPSVEVNETDKEVKVVAELPGLQEKDVNVELRDGLLTISGEKKSETEDKERRFSERYYGRFERSIPVDEVDPDKVAASQGWRSHRNVGEVAERTAEGETDCHQRQVTGERAGACALVRTGL